MGDGGVVWCPVGAAATRTRPGKCRVAVGLGALKQLQQLSDMLGDP